MQYLDVYEGVDLAYHGDSQNRLEFDFTIRPGADPDAIQLSFEGWDAPTLDEDGNLAFGLRSGDLKLLAPVVYQVRADGQRDDVDAEFVLFYAARPSQARCRTSHAATGRAVRPGYCGQ